ncbi:MAG: methylated-DNA--[protein]-cysteine S-methyltransferase [Oscillospiraceae bacterium]|nr:methylated-DNA--[protein]-cysteine S-methyltransferase [Oscillospiraceae bacterium]
MNILKYKSPFGIITVQEKDGAISRIYLPNAEPSGTQPPPAAPPSEKGALGRADLLAAAKIQLTEYFGGKRKTFDLPLNFDGCTDFMKSVYSELMKIPYGETVSYKYIAEKINCPRAYRAVGLANNKNPLPIIIPCHRVIGSDGKLVGYGGGIDLKIKLLEFEKNNK